MGETSGWCWAIDTGNLTHRAASRVSFAELIACRDHPVGEVVHGPFEEAWAIHTRLECDPLETDVLCFLQNVLTVIFRHKLIVPVMHFFSFGETDCLTRSQSLLTLGFQRLEWSTP